MNRDVSGLGIGFRLPLAAKLFEIEPPEVKWLEIHPENYIRRGGKYRAALERAIAKWPIATHGLTMCFGAVEPFDKAFLASLRAFLDEIGSPWHSDHLCFAGVDGVLLHDLLPLPYTKEAVRTVVARVREAQDALERPVAIENISWYGHPGPSEMSELDFHLEVLEGADCKILLDVNNAYVNSRNHGGDPKAFLDAIPKERVVQIHVAGHLVRKDGFIIDTHAEPVCEDVYALLEHVLRRLGPVPILLERDDQFPTFEELHAELRRIDAIVKRAVPA